MFFFLLDSSTSPNCCLNVRFTRQWQRLHQPHSNRFRAAEKPLGVTCGYSWAELSKHSPPLCRKNLSSRIWRTATAPERHGFQMRLRRQILTWPINAPTTTIITCSSPSGSLSPHRQESVLWFLDRGSYWCLFVQSARPHKEFHPSNLLTKQDSNYTGR